MLNTKEESPEEQKARRVFFGKYLKAFKEKDPQKKQVLYQKALFYDQKWRVLTAKREQEEDYE